MAKLEPSMTLAEMEKRLGYKIGTITYPNENSECFYSDLCPVPHNTYQKTRDEFEQSKRNVCRRMQDIAFDKALPRLGEDSVSHP